MVKINFDLLPRFLFDFDIEDEMTLFECFGECQFNFWRYLRTISFLGGTI